MKQNIPHLFTAGNLMGGILAIMFALNGQIMIAPFFILLSAVFDFFDGFLARSLSVQSELGKQLDSLADMVTFGVAPGIIVFVLLDIGNGLMGHSVIQPTHDYLLIHIWPPSCCSSDILYKDDYLLQGQNMYEGAKVILSNWDHGLPSFYRALPFVALLIPIMAMFRLAKFNLGAKQTSQFIGLPTPANAIFFCSIALLLSNLNGTLFTERLPVLFLIHPYILGSLVVIFSILMVVPLPLFSLKFKSFGWKSNEMRYTFLTISLLLLATLFLWALPIIILLYIVLSLLNNLIMKSIIDEIQS